MTSAQTAAFYAGSHMSAKGLSFDIRLMVGGIALLCAVFILSGLMHLLDSNAAWDKTIFVLCLFGLTFILMMIFIYIAY